MSEGVPVSMMVPSSSVVPALSSAIRRLTENVISLVLPSCIVTPFSLVTILRAYGSGILAADTGSETGQKVSKLFPRLNWPPEPLRCHHLALTSLAIA